MFSGLPCVRCTTSGGFRSERTWDHPRSNSPDWPADAIVLVMTLVYLQFRGSHPKTDAMIRAGGLVDGRRIKVTYNGVGSAGLDRVGGGEQRCAAAHLMNVAPLPGRDARQRGRRHPATTIFGNKYVALSSLRNPVRARLASSDVIRTHGHHRVQHAVRDPDLDLGEGRPGQTEPDAERRGEALSAWAPSSASRS